ncbi:MAG: beta strand repeat-containing protein, partial [Campylobacteraceae bacterium]
MKHLLKVFVIFITFGFSLSAQTVIVGESNWTNTSIGIPSVTNGGNATFDSNYTNLSTIQQVNVSDIHIYGNNSVISGNSTSRIFYTSGNFGGVSNITLKDGNRTSGGDAFGGAIYAGTFGGNIFNSTFSNNSASGNWAYGGAIYAGTFGGNIFNSTFSNNSASGNWAFGGAIYAGTFGGNIFNSTFSNNSASGSNALGGAIYVDNTLSGTFQNSNFTNNSASGNNAFGGAIYAYTSNFVVEATSGQTSLFVNNTAGGKPNSIYTYGGAITIDTKDDGVVDIQDPIYARVDAGYALAISKNGTGIWKLGGDTVVERYSGSISSNISINEGTLYLHGASASGGVGTITLNSYGLGNTSTFSLMSNATLIAGGDNNITVISNDDGFTSFSNATMHFYNNSTISGGSGNTSLHVNSSNGNFIYGLVNLHVNNTSDNFTLFTSNSTDNLLSGLSGDGGIVKSGEGRVILDGENSYTNQTLINEGSLRVTNLNSINASSNVTINNQATLELFTGDNTTFTN